MRCESVLRRLTGSFRSFIDDLKQEILFLGANFKETDLFRINQSVDFGNIDESDKAFKAITKLKQTLYSEEFRSFVQDVTRCGKLNNRVDIAANIYSQGCHLGCHDDCISSRRISYILYLSDLGWTAADGGAIELYALDSNIPQKTILPINRSMCMFEVKGGESLHSVQEVYSNTRRRISIQGWFHTDEPILNRELATISQLTKEVSESSILSSPSMEFDLSKFINPSYLSEKGIALLGQSFQQNQCVLMKDFILKPKYAEIAKLAKSCDAIDDFFGEFRKPEYEDGNSSGWKTFGLPYRERFCMFDESAGGVGKTKLGKLGLLLNELKTMFTSVAFLAWLGAVCGSSCSPSDAKVRRFRPGLDYSVAKHAQKVNLFAKLSFCQDSPKWASGDFGGHQIFHQREDSEKAKEEAEVYEASNNAEDLISIEPQANTFSLVSTKANNLLEFVQYVSAGAPSSIFDVALELQ